MPDSSTPSPGILFAYLTVLVRAMIFIPIWSNVCIFGPIFVEFKLPIHTGYCQFSKTIYFTNMQTKSILQSIQFSACNNSGQTQHLPSLQ